MEMGQLREGLVKRNNLDSLFVLHFSLFAPLNFLPLTTSKVSCHHGCNPGAYYRARVSKLESVGHIQPVSCFWTVGELSSFIIFKWLGGKRKIIFCNTSENCINSNFSVHEFQFY